jgi:hypothetical protein
MRVLNNILILFLSVSSSRRLSFCRLSFFLSFCLCTVSPPPSSSLQRSVRRRRRRRRWLREGGGGSSRCRRRRDATVRCPSAIAMTHLSDTSAVALLTLSPNSAATAAWEKSLAADRQKGRNKTGKRDGSADRFSHAFMHAQGQR